MGVGAGFVLKLKIFKDTLMRPCAPLGVIRNKKNKKDTF